MQQWIDLNNKVAHDTMATLKQLGELNMNTAETFFGQQKEVFENYKSSADSDYEKLTAAKDQSTLLNAQNEIFQNTLTSALGNWKNTMAAVVSSQEAYRNLAESTMELAKSNLEQTASSVKQTTEAVEKAVKPTTKSAK